VDKWWVGCASVVISLLEEACVDGGFFKRCEIADLFPGAFPHMRCEAVQISGPDDDRASHLS
jgi:hypothetical protein